MHLKKVDANKKIILDADVIIHFFKADQLPLLFRIFPNRYCILKDVFDEVFKGNLIVQIENAINWKFIEELDFSSDFNVLAEYAQLSKIYGKGESACMAYCKCHKDVLASSNLKDVRRYCEQHSIQYVTTMDFLNTAFENGLLSESECDVFIHSVKSKGSKLPCDSILAYRAQK